MIEELPDHSADLAGTSMPTLDVLQRLAQQFPDAGRWIIAFSGGVDSCVLLHLAVAYLRQRGDAAPELLALHVHHGLHVDAGQWQEHCASICQQLGVEFQARPVEVARGGRTGLERAAREARYAVFATVAGSGDLLLQGHHQDDQAETVLLRLLRGAGPSGLSGIPFQRRLEQSRLVRPLLEYPRAALLEYADHHDLQWIEDPSNLSQSQDRNFLRHQLLPLLRQRWPDIADKLSRTAEACKDWSLLAESQARADMLMRSGVDRFDQHYLEPVGSGELPLPRVRNLIRQWLREVADFAPSRAQLDRLQADLLEAREDAVPRWRVGDVDLRRYRQCIYLVPAFEAVDGALRFAVNGPGSVKLGAAGCLHLQPAVGQGLRRGGSIEIRFRAGAVICRLDGASASRSLKRQLQDLGIAPWLRPRLPLVYVDGELAAIADLAICAGYAAGADEEGLLLRWEYPLRD